MQLIILANVYIWQVAEEIIMFMPGIPQTVFEYTTFFIFDGTTAALIYLLIRYVFTQRPTRKIGAVTFGNVFFMLIFSALHFITRIYIFSNPSPSTYTIVSIVVYVVLALDLLIRYGKAMFQNAVLLFSYDMIFAMPHTAIIMVNQTFNEAATVNYISNVEQIPLFLLNYVLYHGFQLISIYIIYRLRKIARFHWLFIILFSLVLHIYHYNVQSWNYTGYDLLLRFTLTLIVGFGTPFIIMFISNILYNRRVYQENRYLTEITQAQKEYYISLQAHQESVRKMRHDIVNHVRTIQYMSQRNENITAYANEVADTFEAAEQARIDYCDNSMVNAVLASKLSALDETDIQVECNIRLEKNLPIKDIHLTTIFFNLLDNAIRSCQQVVGDRKLSIQSGMKHGGLAIVIKNSIPETEKKRPKKITDFVSKKGLGLQIVYDIVKLYSGTMITDYHEGLYISTIYLPFEKDSTNTEQVEHTSKS